MPASRAELLDQLRENCLDPWWFIPRLQIVDEQGRVNTLWDLRSEQKEFITAALSNRRICILKTRQIGMTTAVAAFLFWKAFVSQDPIGILSITHEDGACGRINEMLTMYADRLPQLLRPSLKPRNTRHIQLAHNKAGFKQLMAGGRGQGRSFTFQNLHCTEMGFWPQGSAAARGKGADRSMWASAMSTIHETADSHVIIESTADGPGGVFHERVRIARQSPEWCFLFFPWIMFGEYQADLPKNWERTDEEQVLADLHGVNDRQLAWRRRKIYDDGYGLTRFRREYPLTWEEPFLVGGSMWFDTELLNHRLGSLDRSKVGDPKELEIYLPFEPWRKYGIGGDASGGTGNDWAVWQVLRDDGAQAAVWRSNRKKPKEQAKHGAMLSSVYGRCPIAMEKNNYGEAVIEELENLGANTWKDEDGKDWWTQGGAKGGTKKKVYDWGAYMIDNGICDLHDVETISELMHIREQDDGSIEANEGHHDDHADALMIGLWITRRWYAGPQKADPVKEMHKQRMRRMKQLKGGK